MSRSRGSWHGGSTCRVWPLPTARRQMVIRGSLPPSATCARRDRILDFIATNPPRFGVNWRCTMDVGIRVANWVVAYDILQAYGARLDSGFLAVLARSVAEHTLFIATNLEWHPVFRSNHYLADICGLAFAAAYLEDARSGRRPPQAERWFSIAVRELAAETDSQFYLDGANKEASVCYHRLSSEMVPLRDSAPRRAPE